MPKGTRTVWLALASALAVSVGGCAGDGGITPTGPTIESVSIQGYGGSVQVRQGAGPVTLEVLGSRLSDVTIASLGDLSGVVIANNPISAVIEFVIPHAVDLGPVTLTLTAAEGQVGHDAAVELTAITAGPSGSDASGRGTPDTPYRSLTHAVEQAEAGDTVALRDGTYSALNGEAWPVIVTDVTVRGESRAGTVLEGPGTAVGIGLEGTAALAHLTVTNFGAAIGTLAGLITIDDVSASGNLFIGIVDGGAGVVTMANVTFDDNGSDGVRLHSGSSYSVTAGSMSGNGGHGFSVKDDSHLALTDVAVDDNGTHGVSLEENATLAMHGGSASGNGSFGIVISDSAQATVTGTTLDDNTSVGIGVRHDGTLVLRSSQVTGSGSFGLRVQDAPTVDLGQVGDVGDNLLAGNSNVQLSDARPADSTPAISAVGVDLGQPGPAPSGMKTGPDSDGAYWQIIGANNQIDFGP